MKRMLIVALFLNVSNAMSSPNATHGSLMEWALAHVEAISYPLHKEAVDYCEDVMRISDIRVPDEKELSKETIDACALISHGAEW